MSEGGESPRGGDAEHTVLYGVEAGVATLTLNRPQRLNAWTPEMSERYFDLLDDAGSDPEVRAIVVTGAGRGFCAGLDVQLLQNIGVTVPTSDPSIRKATYTLSVPKPVIAAINGPCVGVGLVLAAACDIRFVAAGATFAASFVRLGLSAENGISWLLPRLLGLSDALDVLLSGRTFSAAEALQMRFANRVYPGEALLAETLTYVRDLALKCSPDAMATIKRQVYRHMEFDLATALQESRVLRDLAVAGADFNEGMASFRDRRAPEFAPLARGRRADPFA